jgi:acyl-CoA thioester hydrolase
LQHHVTRPDGTVCTIITVDGAWMDLEKRKLTVPNEFIKGIFSEFPKSANFEWLTPKIK